MKITPQRNCIVTVHVTSRHRAQPAKPKSNVTPQLIKFICTAQLETELLLQVTDSYLCYVNVTKSERDRTPNLEKCMQAMTMKLNLGNT